MSVRRAAAALLLLAVILVFGVGQLVLPGIAASTLRDRLAKSGRVLSVQVSAFPAIELLWHQADRVVVHMASYQSDPGRLGSLLRQAGGVGTLRASIGTFRSGLLTLHNVTLRKQGDQLNGAATVLESDLRSAVPVLQSVRLLSAGPDSITLEGTATALGVTATVPATVRPQSGHLVVVPDVPLLSLASVTVFAQPHVQVEGVGGAAIPGGLRVTARARLN